MAIDEFYERYKLSCENLREECDQQVKDGELTQDEADFRYWMVMDEILEAMIDKEN